MRRTSRAVSSSVRRWWFRPLCGVRLQVGRTCSSCSRTSSVARGKLDLSKGSNDQGLDGRNHMEEWGFADMINCGGKGDALARNGAVEPHEPYMAHLKSRDLATEHTDDYRKRGGQSDYSATFPTFTAAPRPGIRSTGEPRLRDEGACSGGRFVKVAPVAQL
jgi:hypothetical protein